MIDGLLMVDIENLKLAFNSFKREDSCHYCVIDNFLEESFAEKIAGDFPAFDSSVYNGNYDNQIELKRTCNIWDRFPQSIYQLLTELNSPQFVSTIGKLTGCDPLCADAGLHGGGLHIHPPGGKLNPHLDYNLHPKLGLQRKFNLLIYLEPNWEESWGGSFGLWNVEDNQPTTVHTKILPKFNRAVFFDTTMNSWHGLADLVSCPDGYARKSIAVYYLTQPPNDAEIRHRARFAPTQEQKDNREILDLIERRSKITSANVEDWDRK